jgi:hypothetical protein
VSLDVSLDVSIHMSSYGHELPPASSDGALSGSSPCLYGTCTLCASHRRPSASSSSELCTWMPNYVQYTHTQPHTHAHTYTPHTHIHACTHISTRTHARTHTHTHTRIRICVRTRIYAYIPYIDHGRARREGAVQVRHRDVGQWRLAMHLGQRVLSYQDISGHIYGHIAAPRVASRSVRPVVLAITLAYQYKSINTCALSHAHMHTRTWTNRPTHTHTHTHTRVPPTAAVRLAFERQGRAWLRYELC